MKSVTITIFTLLFLSACVQVEQPIEKIKIGILEPLTGTTAFIGERVKNSIELAHGELSSEDQALIELIYEDDGCNGKQAVTAVQKLTQTDMVDYIIGPTCNNAAIPTIEILRESGIIYISTGVISEKFAAAGEHHFTLQPRIKDLMYLLADYAYAKEARNMSILYLNDEFGKESVLHFEKRFTELGGNIILKENFAPSDNDFRTQISKLKEQPVDGIFMMSYGSWLVNQLKQMDELGLKTPIYGPVPAQDPKLIEAAGKLAEGIIYPYPDEKTKIQSQIEFAEKYRTKYGIDTEIYAEIGYDTFNILMKVVKKCGKDKQCAKQQLSKLQGYKGAGGILSTDQDGVGKRSIVIKRINNGKFIYVE